MSDTQSLAKFGGEGGAAKIERYTLTPAQRMLTRAIQAGADIDDDQLGNNIRFLIRHRDDENTSARDRLRAAEAIDAILARGISIAKYIDEADRPAKPQKLEHSGEVKLYDQNLDLGSV